MGSRARMDWVVCWTDSLSERKMLMLTGMGDVREPRLRRGLQPLLQWSCKQGCVKRVELVLERGICTTYLFIEH
eukprot:2444643-Ditylum_brightwellii.AAC.1